MYISSYISFKYTRNKRIYHTPQVFPTLDAMKQNELELITWVVVYFGLMNYFTSSELVHQLIYIYRIQSIIESLSHVRFIL